MNNELALARCVSFVLSGASITHIHRCDVIIDTLFGNVVERPSHTVYGTDDVTAPICDGPALKTALLSGLRADLLVVETQADRTLLFQAVGRDLPVVIVRAVANRIWPVAPSELGALCRWYEVACDPAQPMSPQDTRVWRLAQLVRGAVERNITLDELVEMSRRRKRSRRGSQGLQMAG